MESKWKEGSMITVLYDILRELRGIKQELQDIENSLGQYVEGVPEHYCRVNDQIYALPVTPSVQILY